MPYGQPGSFLYHYTTFDCAVESIIPSQTLLLNPFRAMNDPREASDWAITGTMVGDQIPDSLYWDSSRLTNHLKETCKLTCFSEDAVAEDRDDVAREFARGYARPRMWAHYGSNHTGVCLIFDRARLDELVLPALESIGEPFSGSVTYMDAGIPNEATHLDLNDVNARGIEPVLDDLVASYARELFFTKSCDWATEREFRYMVRSRTPGPAFVSVKGALRALCQGSDVHRGSEPKLHRLCAEHDLDLLKMEWNNGEPWILRRPSPGII